MNEKTLEPDNKDPQNTIKSKKILPSIYANTVYYVLYATYYILC